MLLFIVCFERCSLLECSSRSLNIQLTYVNYLKYICESEFQLTYVNYLKYICESEFDLRESPDWSLTEKEGPELIVC